MSRLDHLSTIIASSVTNCVQKSVAEIALSSDLQLENLDQERKKLILVNSKAVEEVSKSNMKWSSVPNVDVQSRNVRREQ
ncbi:hypothetical protein Sjap_021807 [Stephania japonica]|uniref:Uncharacterized protein n=1 Tax=Stephania japonica TaxID=461633 RepID=A0AAP0EMQ0_9MAGN